MQGSSGSIFIPDTAKLEFGNSQDLKIYHDASNSYIQDVGTGQLRFLSNDYVFYNAGGNENIARFIENGAVELYYDNSKKLETRSNGINVTGRIFCDGALANNRGLIFNDNIKISLGSSNDLEILHDGTNSNIHNQTNSLYIRSADTRITNGGVIETWSGGVIVTGTLNLNDNNKIALGNSGSDLEIFHNGTHSRIINSTGNLEIAGSQIDMVDAALSQYAARFDTNDSVDLYYDGSKKFETTSTGANVTSANDAVLKVTTTGTASTDDARIELITQESTFTIQNDRSLGTDGALTISPGSEGGINIFKDGVVQIYNDGSKKFETTSVGFNGIGDNFNLQASDSGSVNLRLQNTGTGTGTNDGFLLQLDSSEHAYVWHRENKNLIFGTNDSTRLLITNDGDVRIPNDSGKLQLGASQDLQIYHDGSNSYISENGTGDLILTGGIIRPRTDQFTLNNAANTENMINALANNAVSLFYDGSTKLQTDSAGTIFYDDTFLGDNLKANFGASADLQIYHDGTNSYVANDTGGGHLILQGNGDTDKVVAINPKFGENGLVAKADGAVELYYDNSLKFKTDSIGCEIAGFLGINVASPDSPLEVAGTGPSLATIHHSDGGTNDEARIMLGALSTNPPDQRGAGISARNTGAGHDLEIQTSSTHSAGPSTKMTVTAGGQVQIANDSGRLQLGASQDLQFYHDGTHSYIQNATGGLYIKVGNGEFLSRNGNEVIAKFLENAAVELYYDNTKKFETTSEGATVTTNSTDTTMQNTSHLVLKNSDNSANTFAGIRFEVSSNTATDHFIVQKKHNSGTGTDLIIGHGSNERVRFLENGALAIGSSSIVDSENRLSVKNDTDSKVAHFHHNHNSQRSCIDCTNGHATGSQSAIMIEFRRADGNSVGGIFASTSNVQYNTASDYRLKENQVAISDGISRLKELKPYRFNWKENKDKIVDGFFAHEVSSVVPEAITGTKDEVNENNDPVYQGIEVTL